MSKRHSLGTLLTRYSSLITPLQSVLRSRSSVPPRTLSLLPAATEIVAALGAVDHLVGVTHECDFPADVESKPRVTASAVDAAGDAASVDARVSELAGAGSPLFRIREERVAALRPELILTQALCDVCAVSETDVRALAGRLRPAPPSRATSTAPAPPRSTPRCARTRRPRSP